MTTDVQLIADEINVLMGGCNTGLLPLNVTRQQTNRDN